MIIAVFQYMPQFTYLHNVELYIFQGIMLHENVFMFTKILLIFLNFEQK